MLLSAAVLWDLDGTLVDSEDLHWQAWRDTIAAEGVSITHQQFLATFGLRNDSVIPQLLGAAVAPERVRRIGEAKEECYRRLVRQGRLSASPGATDWLRRLHRDGWFHAVASSAPRLNVEVVLDTLRLAEYFQAIVSAEDVHTGKPDPEVFLVAAARLNVPPSRCIVIEDAAAGLEAARRAGMRSIALSRTGASLDADVVVTSLATLPPDAFLALLKPDKV
ncbi:MAG: beta-phosphoglucomutase family hydrolase [Acidobacteria bacterium]|nr:beta-phosphoglucomutase family hydrolase [Acidobacteriota bacterium]